MTSLSWPLFREGPLHGESVVAASSKPGRDRSPLMSCCTHHTMRACGCCAEHAAFETAGRRPPHPRRAARHDSPSYFGLQPTDPQPWSFPVGGGRHGWIPHPRPVFPAGRWPPRGGGGGGAPRRAEPRRRGPPAVRRPPPPPGRHSIATCGPSTLRPPVGRYARRRGGAWRRHGRSRARARERRRNYRLPARPPRPRGSARAARGGGYAAPRGCSRPRQRAARAQPRRWAGGGGPFVGRVPPPPAPPRGRPRGGACAPRPPVRGARAAGRPPQRGPGPGAAAALWPRPRRPCRARGGRASADRDGTVSLQEGHGQRQSSGRRRPPPPDRRAAPTGHERPPDHPHNPLPRRSCGRRNDHGDGR